MENCFLSMMQCWKNHFHMNIEHRTALIFPNHIPTHYNGMLQHFFFWFKKIEKFLCKSGIQIRLNFSSPHWIQCETLVWIRQNVKKIYSRFRFCIIRLRSYFLQYFPMHQYIHTRVCGDTGLIGHMEKWERI